MKIRIELLDADLHALDEIARLENQLHSAQVNALDIFQIGLAERLAELNYKADQL